MGRWGDGGGGGWIPHFPLPISCIPLFWEEQRVCTFHFLFAVLPRPPRGTGHLHFSLSTQCTPNNPWRNGGSELSTCNTIFLYSEYTLRGQAVCTFHFLYHVLPLSLEGRGGSTFSTYYTMYSVPPGRGGWSALSTL